MASTAACRPHDGLELTCRSVEIVVDDDVIVPHKLRDLLGGNAEPSANGLIVGGVGAISTAEALLQDRPLRRKNEDRRGITKP